MKVMTLDENGTSGSRFVTFPPLSRDYESKIYSNGTYTRGTRLHKTF